MRGEAPPLMPIFRSGHQAALLAWLFGRSRLVAANTGHPAAVPLTQVLEISFGPQIVIEEEFRLTGAEKVLLFGSWAARFAGVLGASSPSSPSSEVV